MTQINQSNSINECNQSSPGTKSINQINQSTCQLSQSNQSMNFIWGQNEHSTRLQIDSQVHRHWERLFAAYRRWPQGQNHSWSASMLWCLGTAFCNTLYQGCPDRQGSTQSLVSTSTTQSQGSKQPWSKLTTKWCWGAVPFPLDADYTAAWASWTMETRLYFAQKGPPWSTSHCTCSFVNKYACCIHWAQA